ncbi:hypothetical protein C0J52_07170 [Blattella germanica]|nr:hypothetical protein C0J52_07170 [Blattella germanica]
MCPETIKGAEFIMEDEIIRKICNRASYPPRQIPKNSSKYGATSVTGTNKCHTSMNNEKFSPPMCSTPYSLSQKKKRKNLNEEYFTEKKVMRKICSDMAKGNSVSDVRNSRLLKCATTSQISKFKSKTKCSGDISKKLRDHSFSKCNDSFSSRVSVSSPSSSQMLSLDDTLLKAVNLDVSPSVKCSETVGLKSQEQCGSPVFVKESNVEKTLELILSKPNTPVKETLVDDHHEEMCIIKAKNDTNILKTSNKNKHKNITLQPKVFSQTTSEQTKCANISNNEKDQHFETGSFILEGLQNVDIDWDNDSMLNGILTKEVPVPAQNPFHMTPEFISEKITKTLATKNWSQETINSVCEALQALNIDWNSNSMINKETSISKLDSCQGNSIPISDIMKDIVDSKKWPGETISLVSEVLKVLGFGRNTDSMVNEMVAKEPEISPPKASMPLSEKIRKALINNVQRPVTHRPKTMELNVQERIATNLNNENLFDIGPFFGLPSKVKSFILKLKGIVDLYDWQKECLSLDAVQEKKNLIYALPTSGGKTLVAEILILREILCYKKNAIFILPYVSLVQEKVRSLSPFGLEYDFFLEEYAAGKGQYPPRKRRRKQSLYIATIEKALGLVNSLIELQRLEEIGLVVVDEIHLLGESGRGSTLEGLLTKLLYCGGSIQIVGMSATIGNVHQVASYLNASTYLQNFRPVELQEYVKYENNLYSVNSAAIIPENILKFGKKISFNYSPAATKIDPDCVGGLVAEVIPKNSCLVFCPTKKNCENVALMICNVLPKDIISHKLDEKRALYEALKRLTSDERCLIEEAYRIGTLSCICCTSTLAAGVNLPAKRVILRGPYVGRDFINLTRYKQMIGRAGRAGFDEAGESILMCKQNDIDKVRDLLKSSMDEVVSNLHLNERQGLQNLVLSIIGLGMDIKYNKFNVLNYSSNVSTSIINTSNVSVQLNDTSDSGTVRDETKTPVKTNDRKKIQLNNHSELRISTLGKAAIKDLYQGQAALVLLSCLHLLYLVTPYDLATQIKPNYVIYFSVFNRLSRDDLQTAHILGINEVCMLRLRNGLLVKRIPERVIQRFYLTLMLHDLWKQKSVWDVAAEFEVPRGFIQTLMTSAATFATCVLRFCEEIPQFWAYKELLVNFTQQLSHCCTAELLPLMDLPAVKRGRAKQLYKAGYKSLQHVANANAMDMVRSIQHLPTKVANQIISAAKLLLKQKADSLREEAEEVMEGIVTNEK